MSVSIFAEKTEKPNEVMVEKVLGVTFSLWKKLEEEIVTEYPKTVGEWKHYGKTSGWTYLLKSEKRTLIYLIPRENHFRIRVVLGEKAVAIALSDELLESIKDVIEQATAYVEGRSIDIDIRQVEQLQVIKRLLEIKYES